MNITENNVVQHIQNKNEQAIPFLIQQYGGLLAVIIKRHLHNSQQDYEECLDDVLLSVWDHIDSFDAGKNSFKQWIAAIAKYKAIDYQRRRIKINNQQFSVADLNEIYRKPATSHENIQVDELLSLLPAKERKIFEKYYLEGAPSSEIAKEFAEKESWVHNKLSRGRKKLKRFLLQKNEV